MVKRFIAAGWVLVAAMSCGAAGPVWPQFRGPDAAGIVEDDPRLPDQWDEQTNVLWKASIPGQGWSSPIVWEDKVFVTTAVAQGETEPPKKGLYLHGERPASTQAFRWTLLCLDAPSGKVLWEAVAHEGVPAGPKHVKNSYASETPVTDGERVYAYFGNVGLFSFDFQGQLAWSKRWDPVKTEGDWGTAASPVLCEDRLFIVNDNETKSFLVALDKKTGEEIWRVDRDEKSNWATPYIWKNDLRTEIITPGTGKSRSYDLEGRALWELTCSSGITIPTPFSRFGLLYVCSGFILGKSKPLLAIRPGASGDISLKEGESSNAFIAWSQPKAAPYNPSALGYGDHIYVLLDQGFLSCYDAKTGEPKYERQKLTKGSAFTSSPWAYNGKVFCLSEDGDTNVVSAGPAFQAMGVNSLGAMCLATPAIANGSLFIRTSVALYRVQATVSPPP